MSQLFSDTTDQLKDLFVDSDFEPSTNRSFLSALAPDYELTGPNGIVGSYLFDINLDEATSSLNFGQNFDAPIDYDTIDIGNFETSLTPSLPEAMKSTEPSRRKWPKRPGRYKNASPTAKHRRREQCREAQRKYRERRDDRVAQLETALKEVQYERDSLIASYLDFRTRYEALLTRLVLSGVSDDALSEHITGWASSSTVDVFDDPSQFFDSALVCGDETANSKITDKVGSLNLKL